MYIISYELDAFIDNTPRTSSE